MIGEFKTTFWQDFSIADRFGINAIKDTYKRVFDEWKNNTEYVTELVVVLNWKLWYHWENGNHDVSKIYDELWKKTENWCYKHLKGNDLEYFIKTID